MDGKNSGGRNMLGSAFRKGNIWGRISVSADILSGIEAVRKSGRTNMFDRPNVIDIAIDLGFSKTARWIETNPREYAEGIFHGFQVDNQD